MRFDSPFSFDEWKNHLKDDLSTVQFAAPAEEVKARHDIVDDVQSLGTLALPDGKVPLYHIILNAKATPRARVRLTRSAYDTIKHDTAIGSALFFITYANAPEKYRLSYVKVDLKSKSDPKRYTYLLGEGVPKHTPETRLQPSAFASIGAIEEAFSVEPVNSEFYRGIQGFFQTLKTSLGDNAEARDRAIRFIGRVLFCRFLAAKDLVPMELLDEAASAKKSYQNILSPLFFGTLNTEYGKRQHLQKYESQIPFLNGGLFAPKAGEEGLAVPDTLITELFKFLKKYNFTVDESTPTEIEVSIDPEMLGRVFENLLAEINPDTQESARKATGAFYTPREIVDYMVVESLKKYLHNRIKIDEERLSALFSIIKPHVLGPAELKTIGEALDELKILDPACGSGAFPMGLLQRLFDLKRKLCLESLSPYEAKLKILQNSIYGVDIQPIAVEISKLRAFLSIVLEEERRPEAPNLGISPLPNLEFNFIIANSLVGLEAEMDGSFRGNFLAGVVRQINDIAKLFFTANSPDKKLQVQQRFEAHRHNVETADEAYVTPEDKAKLLSYDPFHNKAALFFEPHIQFGIEPDKNFGIVIGNPPYVQLQSRNPGEKELYQNQLYYSYTRVGDLYQLFYERALNLLSARGVASLITSNKWMRAGYGISSRNFFRNHAQIYGLVDLGSGRFESATVDTNILFYGRRGKDALKPTAPALTYKGSLDALPPLDDKKAFNRITIGEEDESWLVLTDTERQILQKMQAAGKPLKDWDVTINSGIKTGLNEAFIIDGAAKDALIAEDAKSAEILKPLLKGRDIKRYGVEFADKWLIATLPALKLDIDHYPAIKKYLSAFRPRIDQSGEKGCRKFTHNKWFETQDAIAYYKDFEKPKIIFNKASQINTFYLDDHGYFGDVTTYIISGNSLTYLCGVLNSKLFENCYPKYYAGGGIEGELTIFTLDKFPIPVPTAETEAQMAGLVDKILLARAAGEPTAGFGRPLAIHGGAGTAGIPALEAEIDALVYGLYGLDRAEIAMVEG